MRGVRTDVLVIAVVLVTAYSLYPVGFAALTPSQPASETTSAAAASEEAATTEEAAPLQFRNATAGSGFDYRYVDEYEGSRSMMSNAGVYASDYDDDGWTDVLAIGGERPVLFENREGRFERSGALTDLNRSFRAALWFDYDADGREDLLLLPMGAPPVLLENHDGEFVRRDTGLDVSLTVPTGAAAADYDGDGCLDVFVAQNGDWVGTHPEGLRNYSVAETGDNGGRNLLLRGDCETFEDVSDRAGVGGERWSLATSFTDVDGDGLPDVHVANDFGHDAVYYHQGDGTFEKVRLGDRTNRNGMSSEVADLTGDGRMDVFVTNVYFPAVLDDAVDSTMEIRADGNNLLVGEDGGFDEAAAVYGVREGGWGWAAVAADLTNDGSFDLFHTTREMNLEKYRRTMRDAEVDYLQSAFSYFDYPAVWRGTGTGFAAVDPEDSGFDAANGRGVASLDYDNDGRLDLVVADAGGRYVLYENAESGGNAVQVDVRDADGGPALGARVEVTAGNQTQVRRVTDETDFLSQDSRIRHVGTGNQTRVDVTVTWTDGTTQSFEAVEAGQRITVTPDGIERSTPFASADG